MARTGITLLYLLPTLHVVGRDSSVGVATRYGLKGPHLSKPALGPTQPPIQWVPDLSGGVNLPGRGVDLAPHLAPRLKKEYSYNSTTPLGLRSLF